MLSLLCNIVDKVSIPVNLRFIVFIFLVREDFDWFLWLHYSVSMAVSHVVSSSEEVVRVQVSIATVRDAVRTAVLVMELPVRTNVITESVCTWIKDKTGIDKMI